MTTQEVIEQHQDLFEALIKARIHEIDFGRAELNFNRGNIQEIKITLTTFKKRDEKV